MGLVKRGLGESKIFQFKNKTTSKTSNNANDQSQKWWHDHHIRSICIIGGIDH